jgi:hypothetical protein
MHADLISKQHLEFAMEFPRLKDLRFRRLKRLKLPLQSGGTISLDASSTAFLEHHPTLEELNWFPIGQINFSSCILPSLKRLQSDIQVIDALEKTGLSRSIECLSIRSLNPQRLIDMKHVDHTSLRKLSIPRIPSLEYIPHLGESFSGITWLSISYGEIFRLVRTSVLFIFQPTDVSSAQVYLVSYTFLLSEP